MFIFHNFLNYKFVLLFIFLFDYVKIIIFWETAKFFWENLIFIFYRKNCPRTQAYFPARLNLIEIIKAADSSGFWGNFWIFRWK